MHVFQKRASELHAPIFFADQHVNAGEEILSASPLKGCYQRKNITSVLGAIRVLNSTGMNIPENIVRRGISHVVRNTRLAGRWQILAHRPLTICDTGHNEAGIRLVVEQIRNTPHEALHFVFGMVADKEPAKILSLLPRDARYYFCKPGIPRGLDAGELAKMAGGAGLQGTVHGSVAEALAAAKANANAGDMIFIGGSTFVVAEVV
jgi:dihydrofolate synthase/folylpolyglutamate synthase